MSLICIESAQHCLILMFTLWYSETVPCALVDPRTLRVTQEKKWRWAPRGRQRVIRGDRTNHALPSVEAPRLIQSETLDSQVRTNSWRHLIWLKCQVSLRWVLTNSFVCLIDASSEHMSIMETTDSEDSPRSAVQRGSGSSRVSVVGGSYSGLSPMIIMNNVLFKQVTH